MSTPTIRRVRGVLALCTLLAAACGDDTGTTVVLPARLRPGTWYIHEANGDTLPAEIGKRTVGIAQEITYIDSATITIVAGGTWQQKVFLRMTLNGATDRQELFYDQGNWAAGSVGYTLVSTIRSRSTAVTMGSSTLMNTTESLLSWTAAPTVTGAYRTTPP